MRTSSSLFELLDKKDSAIEDALARLTPDSGGERGEGSAIKVNTELSRSLQVAGNKDYRKTAEYYGKSLINMMKEKMNEESDEDRLFLLSLVAAFKKLTEEQKLQAKIEFLKVIQKITSEPRQKISNL
ncbi:hypothetical protein R5R35_004682 [Gryllus longicercus]|uniref:BESS domain-containing protein n=1 Tax=Gryllus longicercus TaxID=2509291 RepID=A0AAN9ZGB8_9ORTH